MHLQPLIVKTNTNLHIPQKIAMYANPDICLMASILLETVSTCCLKCTLTNSLFYIPAYIGYGISFYLFPKALTKYSLNIAYTMWSGIGIIFTTLYDVFVHSTVLGPQRILGMVLVLIGIYFTSYG